MGGRQRTTLFMTIDTSAPMKKEKKEEKEVKGKKGKGRR